LKKFVQEDAWAIQKKLKADVEHGRGHDLVKFRHNGVLVVQFGIRRASKEKGHGYIPSEMKISQKECREFRQCTMSVEEYLEILRGKGFIAAQ
jgi:hypothetical protein